MRTVYVLQCENNRYYVGKTDRPLETRVEEHFNRCGSEWTQKYRPIKVVEIKQNADEFDEDKYTKIYMKKHGIDKVRGGTHTQLKLHDYQLMTLEKELRNASDLCFRCNRPGHYANNCYAKSKEKTCKSKKTIIPTFIDKKPYVLTTQSCFRCGRSGHYANNCYASTHTNRKKLY